MDREDHLRILERFGVLDPGRLLRDRMSMLKNENRMELKRKSALLIFNSKKKSSYPNRGDLENSLLIFFNLTSILSETTDFLL